MYTVYGKPNCTFCTQANQLLEQHGEAYRYVDVLQDTDALTMLKENGFRTVPQIYKDGMHIGGFTELHEILTSA